jgi:hypothetical protein
MEGELEQIMQEITGQELSGLDINVIPINEYVRRDFIGFAYRDMQKAGPDGSIKRIRTFYLKKFHCDHYCFGIKSFGMDCGNHVTKFRKRWRGTYHIVCKQCIIPRGCAACGRPGCKVCFFKYGSEWYCGDCIRNSDAISGRQKFTLWTLGY